MKGKSGVYGKICNYLIIYIDKTYERIAENNLSI